MTPTERSEWQLNLNEVAELFAQSRLAVEDIGERLQKQQGRMLINLGIAAAELGHAEVTGTLVNCGVNILTGRQPEEYMLEHGQDTPVLVAMGVKEVRFILLNAQLVQMDRYLAGQAEDWQLTPENLPEIMSGLIDVAVTEVNARLETEGAVLIEPVADKSDVEGTDPWEEVPEWVRGWFDQNVGQISINGVVVEGVPQSEISRWLLTGVTESSANYKLRQLRNKSGAAGRLVVNVGMRGRQIILDSDNFGLLAREMVRGGNLVSPEEFQYRLDGEEKETTQEDWESEYQTWREPDWLAEWLVKTATRIEKYPEIVVPQTAIIDQLLSLGEASYKQKTDWLRIMRDKFGVEVETRFAFRKGWAGYYTTTNFRKLVWILEREKALVSPVEERDDAMPREEPIAMALSSNKVVVPATGVDNSPVTGTLEAGNQGEVIDPIEMALIQSEKLKVKASWLSEALNSIVFSRDEGKEIILYWEGLLRMVQAKKPGDSGRISELRAGFKREKTSGQGKAVWVISLAEAIRFLEGAAKTNWAEIINPLI